jgi:hypothetical protein
MCPIAVILIAKAALTRTAAPVSAMAALAPTVMRAALVALTRPIRVTAAEIPAVTQGDAEAAAAEIECRG